MRGSPSITKRPKSVSKSKNWRPEGVGDRGVDAAAVGGLCVRVVVVAVVLGGRAARRRGHPAAALPDDGGGRAVLNCKDWLVGCVTCRPGVVEFRF